ncbi:1,6-anhydro-N-acetylmuramyl-L-alanine amidase AmpD [Alcaligenaceae bacterium]|nr:1,6-anhydro-N-acetylmuramyl-L-alanine amidase AmpD [Alcaligenaceae bacterium]
MSCPPLLLDRQGWLTRVPGIVTHNASPNCDTRPGNEEPTLLVIHNISLPPGVFGGPEVADLFTNQLNYDSHPWLERLRGLHVSAHFFIRRDGSVIQFVPTSLRAWHAGVSQFEHRERCNDFSLGIELEGTDTTPFTDEQYSTLNRLTHVLRTRHPLRAVRGHEHIAPGRKTDPGPCFDWARYEHESDWFRRQLPAL